jgi:hypothetical protein
VALLVGGSEAPSVESLLNNPNVRLMNFSLADAFMRVFPDLVRLVLPKGVVQLDPPNPPDDITLIGTTAKVLIRDDLHPAIIQLLAQTLKEEHSGAGLFQRSGEFPTTDDPEYTMSSVAVEYYRNGPFAICEISAPLEDYICTKDNCFSGCSASDRFSSFWHCAKVVRMVCATTVPAVLSAAESP